MEPVTSQMCNFPKHGWKKVIRGKGQEGFKKPEAPFAFKSTISLPLGLFHVLEGQQGRGTPCSQLKELGPHQGFLSMSLQLKSKVTLGPRPAWFQCVQFSGIKLDSSRPYMCKFLFFKGVWLGHLWWAFTKMVKERYRDTHATQLLH